MSHAGFDGFARLSGGGPPPLGFASLRGLRPCGLAARRLRFAPPACLGGFAVALLVPALAYAAEGGGVADLFYPALNLLLLLVVLAVLLRKPIRGYFSDRRLRIQGEIEEATRLRKKAEERYASWQKRMSELDAELERIRNTARQRAEAERDRIIEAARATAERIRHDAGVAVEHELRRAREQLREDAADLAVELAGDLVREQLDDADRKRLLDEFIDTIQGSAPEAKPSEGGPPQGGGN